MKPLGNLLFTLTGFFCWTAFTVVFAAENTPRPNVLFIAIDDLRPALGCYGDPVAVTPNIDRLATQGTLFKRAYCQQAVCSPSRLSLMTGLRPDTIRVWDLQTHFRAALPDIVSMPQCFKNHGYHTQSVGKIYHGSGKPSRDPPSWSVDPRYDYVRDPKVRYALPENLKVKGLKQAAFESADVPDHTYIDGVVCETALKSLADLVEAKQPFFLAVGFRKPHLPFCAPKKYWDLYDRAKIPLPSNPSHPLGAPELGTRSWKELEGYTNIPQDMKLSTELIRELRHGYYSCVSYVDALVGRLINELRIQGVAENTVVILCGDHGYHLGEQGLWTKANNYELSTRVPLIVADPKQAHHGTVSNALVELVDVYPTIAEICQLNIPEGLEGLSFAPLLVSPESAWKEAVFSQYPRAGSGARHRGHGETMGYAVRTHRYRYVQWQDWISRKVLAAELYDHELDPNETKNLISQRKYKEVVEELSETMNLGWQSVLPDSVRSVR